MRTTVLLGATALLLVAGGTPQDASTVELKKFAGTWVLVSGEVDGKQVAPEHVEKSKITWQGTKAMLLTPHQSREVIRADTSLDPTQTPKHIDWVRATEPGRGKKFQGIYEFRGDDQYRICFAPPGQPRPTEFKTAPGTGHILHVWKRAKQ